jgi:AbrB family looped-hinge helix DNA binding protein
MKKEFVKIVQSDKRGQIVIPKKIRLELGIEDGAAFWIYKVDDEIRLKKIEGPKIK